MDSSHAKHSMIIFPTKWQMSNQVRVEPQPADRNLFLFPNMIFSDWGDIKICWFPTTFPIHFDISRWNLRHIWHIPPKMAHQKMIKSKVHPIDLKNMFFRHAEENYHCAKTSTWDLGILVPSTLGRKLWAEGLRGWIKSVSKNPKNLLVELRGLKFCANTKRIGIS